MTPPRDQPPPPPPRKTWEQACADLAEIVRIRDELGCGMDTACWMFSMNQEATSTAASAASTATAESIMEVMAKLPPPPPRGRFIAALDVREKLAAADCVPRAFAGALPIDFTDAMPSGTVRFLPEMAAALSIPAPMLGPEPFGRSFAERMTWALPPLTPLAPAILSVDVPESPCGWATKSKRIKRRLRLMKRHINLAARVGLPVRLERRLRRELRWLQRATGEEARRGD